MSNFKGNGRLGALLRDTIYNQQSPTNTIGDIIYRVRSRAGMENDRIANVLSGVLIPLSDEQLQAIASELGLNYQDVRVLYDADWAAINQTDPATRPYQSFLDIMSKEKRVIDTDELGKLIGDLVARTLEEKMRPILVRLSEIEHRTMRMVDFDLPGVQIASTQEKSISTGTRVPAFDWLTDSMHGRVKAHLEPVETSIEPERDRHIEPPAFAMLKQQLRALNI